MIKRIFTWCLLMVPVMASQAQTDSMYTFTLAGAQQHALQNNLEKRTPSLTCWLHKRKYGKPRP
ncbi:MAG: hypothetical protein HC896_05750 [Bacteroidales bacterium]|nr:hypothetical protein [Bacteroidales bacterium]